MGTILMANKQNRSQSKNGANSTEQVTSSKASPETTTKNMSSASLELEQLRQIVFGDAQAALEDQIMALRKDLASLASEHEMFATATQQDLKQLEDSLDNESNTLASNFNQQMVELKAHLEKVSNELTSSKTDRKTLAKLLAAMATNLEDDEL